MSKDIISIKTRQVFREQMVGWVLRQISDEFDSAKIECDLSYQPDLSGQRRTLVEQYYHTVNWTDWTQVKKVLQVFEVALLDADRLAKEPDDYYQKQRQADFDKMIWCLKRDGFQWTDGRIVAGGTLSLLNDVKITAEAFDATHMRDQIRRMEASVESDPALAIGTAKEFVETCCKIILAERGKPMTGNEDIPTLTKAVAKELGLVPDDVPEARRGREVIKRLLRSLGTIGNDLAELRGLYGTGHGKDGKAKGLTTRHAKLAVGAAATLATFLFETHKETAT